MKGEWLAGLPCRQRQARFQFGRRFSSATGASRAGQSATVSRPEQAEGPPCQEAGNLRMHRVTARQLAASIAT